LWHSDVLAYAQEGKSITLAVYVKRQCGPVPTTIMSARARLAAGGAILEREAILNGYPEVQFISLRPADISMFTAMQISLVDNVLEAICSSQTASGVSSCLTISFGNRPRSAKKFQCLRRPLAGTSAK
jgi:hypothetical protein